MPNTVSNTTSLGFGSGFKMDPQSTIMNDTGDFQTTPFNLADIWQLPINSSGDSGRSPYNFPSSATVAHSPMNDPMVLDQRTRKRSNDGDDDESAKRVSTSGNGLSKSDSKRHKATRSDENCDPRGDGEGNLPKHAKPAEPPKGYIQVRARRGQATDSHSLAERARRERISERMKFLQDLVPGCNKVIGKALVLDEIINYVQSLQRQVEFLSMKLEAVNSRTPSMEGFPAKDTRQQTFVTNAMAFGSQATREYARGTAPEWLHMQLGGGFERRT